MADAGLRVRGFEAKDAQDVIRLHRDFNQWFEESELTPEYVLQCSARGDFRFFIAESGRTVVGFLGVLFYESVGRAEVGPICVQSTFQKKGAGSRLLESVVEFLKSRSVHRVVAKVKQGNMAGVGFFRANGFEEEATLRRYTRKGEAVLQMVRFL